MPRGRHRYYRARREALGPLAEYLQGLWMKQLTTLKQLAEEHERTTRAGRGRRRSRK
jgi:hypothetical protein